MPSQQMPLAMQKSPAMRFFVLRVFPLIFLAVGASVGLLGFRDLARAKASAEWPSVQGTVVESSVRRRYSSEGGRTYHAEVLYEFTVKGDAYMENRVAYGDYGSSNPNHAREIVNLYPQGAAVSVHYMPGNPKECLLEPGQKAQSWFLPGFGLVFFTVGILMAWGLPKAVGMRATADPEPGE